MRCYKKIISLGKIDYLNIGKKNCEITIEIELKITDDKKEILSIVGNIWNPFKSDICCGGQILDEIYKYKKHNKIFIKIYNWWKKYHLNDLHAGTEKQEEAIEKWRKENNITGWAYDKEVEYLKSIGLYEDNGYKYGTNWLYRAIPEKDLKEIKEFLEIGEVIK